MDRRGFIVSGLAAQAAAKPWAQSLSPEPPSPQRYGRFTEGGVLTSDISAAELAQLVTDSPAPAGRLSWRRATVRRPEKIPLAFAVRSLYVPLRMPTHTQDPVDRFTRRIEELCGVPRVHGPGGLVFKQIPVG